MAKQTKENKRVLYTKLAKFYDYLAPSTTKQESNFLNEVFKRFGDGPILKVLDLGCGTGRHASLLQKMGYEVTGIDLSTPMLKVAKEKSPKSFFIKMDFCSPKFNQDFFDASVCMWSTIGYILDEKKFKKFIKNVSKVTRKILVLSSTNHEGDNFQPNEVVEKITQIPEGEIMTRMIRSYNNKTGIRNEKYEYSILENGQKFDFIDHNKLRLWKFGEIKKLLLPEFEVLKIYGDYSVNDHFDQYKSSKKIIISRKI